MKALHEYTAVELRKLLAEGVITAEGLTRYYLRRIETYDQPCGLNSVAFFDPTSIRQAQQLDKRRDKKDLPLFGLPILIKDNIDVAGLPTTAGSCMLTDNIAVKDAPIVANLRKNGAVILGKTNMTEFAHYTSDDMPNGFSSRGGQVHCAYDANHDPSGSSTGSAVAMSAGFCAAAVGTDTCFSIVGCVTEHGVTGFKPGCGSLPGTGIIPIATTIDMAGPITKTVEDAMLVYSGMADKQITVQPAHIKGLRLAVNTYGLDDLPQEERDSYQRLLDALQKDGAVVQQVSHPNSPHQRIIHRCEFREDLERYLANNKVRRGTLESIIKGYKADPEVRMPYGINILENAMVHSRDLPIYAEAMAERQKARVALLEELKDVDACIMTGGTNIMHFTGLPSIALPMCMGEDGVPLGVILYGAEERRLLAAALVIQRYCAGSQPPHLD